MYSKQHFLPCISTVIWPGNPLASMLNTQGSATMPFDKPGPSIEGEVSSAISCTYGEPKEIYVKSLRTDTAIWSHFQGYTYKR